MKKYFVTYVRVEHTVYRIGVMAENPEQAEELAQDVWDRGDIDLDTGEVEIGRAHV